MRSRAFVIVLSALTFAGSLAAQETKVGDDKKSPDVPFEFKNIWLTDVGVGAQGCAACLGQVPPASAAWNPIGVVCARVMGGHPTKGLPGWQFEFDEALPIWHRYLELIQDGRNLPTVNRVELKELRGPDWGMYLALIQGIDRSYTSTLDQFKKSAEAYDHVGYPQLQKGAAQYRGKVITVKGHITRVFKVDAPRHVTSDIRHVYTTHIQTPFKGEPPFAVVFTDLPQGVSYKDKLDMTVTFYGYFLGFVNFPGDVKKGEKDVISPYFVGKTLELNRVVTPPPDYSYSYDLIVGSIGIIVAILALTVLLNFWFRRGDRRIESQLASVRDKHHPFSLEPEAPEAPPIAEPVKPNETPPTNG